MSVSTSLMLLKLAPRLQLIDVPEIFGRGRSWLSCLPGYLTSCLTKKYLQVHTTRSQCSSSSSVHRYRNYVAWLVMLCLFFPVIYRGRIMEALFWASSAHMYEIVPAEASERPSASLRNSQSPERDRLLPEREIVGAAGMITESQDYHDNP